MRESVGTGWRIMGQGAVVLCLLLGLLWAKTHNYLLFHYLAELFGIVTGAGVFVVAWNARRFHEDNHLTVLGIAFLFVAGLDLVHTLAYKGMNVFPGYDSNLPTQLWIAARYLQSLAMLAVPMLVGRRIRPVPVLGGFLCLFGLLLAAIFGGIFPDCFVEGRGLTGFKRVSEYIICVILLTAMVHLWRQRHALHRQVYFLLLGAMGVTVLQELCFTLYHDPYADWNFAGHCLKILAFFLVYIAIVQTGISRPAELLFRDIDQSRQRLELAQRAGRIGTFEWDLRGEKKIHVSGMESVYGAEPGPPVHSYEDWRRRVHPQDIQRVEQVIAVALAGTSEYEVEYRILRPDGSIRWVGARGEVHRDEQGQPLRMIGVNMDITDRKQAEEALRDSEELFRRFFDNAPLGKTLTAPDGRLLRVNGALCQMLGYAAAELVGNSFTDITHPDDLPPSREGMRAMLAGERDSWDTEKRYLAKDGCTVWARVVSTLLRDPSGQPLRFLTHVLDITERRRAEEKLKAAKAAAEDASKAKDHFLAVLSHELRTPLTPVLNAASILEKNPELPAGCREDVRLIRRNVELEARLIDDLLDVTRIVRGKIELHRRPIFLGEVIRHAVDVCRADIEARRLDFDLDLADGASCLVDADAARLQQVFWNLLKNAAKFTPAGGFVGIRTRCESDGHVFVEVRDSGVGITPELLPRLFTPFEQGGVETTRQFGGLGLGLVITRGLVELHGGAISAHSDGKGKGASFRIRLPVSQQRAAAEPSRPTTRSAATPGTTPVRILLVEDHDDTARIMRRLLMGDGHAVKTAGNAATALELAGRDHFELLISDLGLPDCSGIELMRELRRRGNTVPGIALSGYGQEEDIRQSREAGFAVHLTKPTSPERLADAIAVLTGNRPAPE